MKTPQTHTETMKSHSQVSYPIYNEMADRPVSIKTLEEEFISRLALVEDLHKRFHFMVSELKSAGLKVENDHE